MGRQILHPHDVLREPGGVGMLGRQLGLDLLVVDDPPLRGVHQEDAAGMQALLDQDVLRRDVQHPHLGGHDDQAVLGHVVAGRPQPVAVEHGPDHAAVGERDGRGAIPRLHQRGVVLVERPPLGAHRFVVLPRLGNHHEDRVRQRAAVHDEELEHVVEGGRVAQPLARHRQHLAQVLPQGLRAAQRLAGAHPVDVAAQRVDLAVVRHVPVRDAPAARTGRCWC